MSFKRDIVIKNEFSVKRAGQGTHGNTPGKFVLRYMARDGATETVTPVTKAPIDNFITRYMARDNATETASNLPKLQEDFKKAQGLGGRGFGQDGKNSLPDPSLSDKSIHEISRHIQQGFDKGNTVLRGVISFDGNYLKRNDIANPDVPLDSHGHAYKKGAFRNNIDQMKLRLAIMNGMRRMANRKVNGHARFDDMAYVGVIQVDTKQVHCHFACVDLGVGQRILTNGRNEQRGMISEKDMMALRHGIDAALEEYQAIKQISVAITRERQDTRGYVKRFTQKVMQESSFGQLLMAALPDDQSLWRARSNAKEMKQANTILRFYVMQVLSQPDSGYQNATRNIQQYAENKREREDLSDREYEQLIDNGQNRLIDSCMDAIYGICRRVPKQEQNTHTEIIDSLTSDINDLADWQNLHPRNPAMEFSYHLRSYTRRLKKHREEALKYKRAEIDYLKRERAGETDNDSLAMLNFYRTEGEYQNMLMTKYQLMMPLISRDQRWKKRQKSLKKEHDLLLKMRNMQQDEAIATAASEIAEKLGKEKYSLDGGRFVSEMPDVYKEKFKRQIDHYQAGLMTFKQDLALDNRTLKYNKKGEAVSQKVAPYKFSDVKMLDLHDMQNDFPNTKVPPKYRDIYLREAAIRNRAYKAAVNYALRTNQPNILLNIDTSDISKMNQYVQNIQKGQDNIKQNNDLKKPEIRQKTTVSVDSKLTEQMKQEIKQTVEKTNEELITGQVNVINNNEKKSLAE